MSINFDSRPVAEVDAKLPKSYSKNKYQIKPWRNNLQSRWEQVAARALILPAAGSVGC